MTEFPDPWRELGSFIREQRAGARLSLRRLSDLTGISNPYLSQIERGLRRPSAEILQQIAKALTISAETLYVRAGILEARRLEGDLADAILAEGSLTVEQRQTLLRIFLSFRRENEGRREDEDGREHEGRREHQRDGGQGAPAGPGGEGVEASGEPRIAGATR